MIDVLFLAVALSMDAFAVSIGLGSKQKTITIALAFKAGAYFGIFQALMPLIGYLGGRGIVGWVEGYAHWVAFLLLVLIGGKMIYESFAEGIEEDIVKITHRVMLILAIVTSTDAMVAGFTLTLLDVNLFIACMIIGITTFCFSWLGVFVGVKSGAWLESKAGLLGGVILIVIGLKVLLS